MSKTVLNSIKGQAIAPVFHLQQATAQPCCTTALSPDLNIVNMTSFYTALVPVQKATGKNYFRTLIVMLAALLLLNVQQGNAQVNISNGNTVTENFDGIGTSATASLPSGWKIENVTGARTVTTAYTSVANNTTTIATTAGTAMSTTAGNGRYNFAGTTNTDRAVGGLSSSSASQTVTMYLQLTNNGASTIGSFNIGYKAERNRNGSNTAGFSIRFYYSTTGAANSWVEVPALIASFAANADNNGSTSMPMETITVSNKTLSQSLAAGSSIYLAWSYSVTSTTTTSNAQAIGIDDISITAVAPTPNLSINDVSQSEGNSGTTNYTFTVSLSSAAPAGGVTFDIATADGTASSATDYTAKTLTSQTIPAGSSSYTFTVAVNGDKDVESNETFFVNVTNVSGATVTDGQGQGTIQNDDVDYTITASAGTGGTISPSGAVTVHQNDNQSFTITANSGYRISDVLVNSSSVGAQSSYTFSNVTANQTISASFLPVTIDYANLQFPQTASVTQGNNMTAYAQVYTAGVTEAAGANSQISAWIGYSSTNSDPSGAGWTWVAATYNTQSGNNDEYMASFGSALAPGTYYYASRFQRNGGQFYYGGYPNGFWNGTTQVSGVLTVNAITYAITSSAGAGGSISPSGTTNVNQGADQAYTITANSGYAINDVLVDASSISAQSTYTFTNVQATHTISASFKKVGIEYANLQFPGSATITAGGSINVYAQVYSAGVTEAAGAGAGMSAWIGYSSSNTDPSGAGWTWVAASFNTQVGNNDEFTATIGAALPAGTYYYASRFQLNGGSYYYGGFNGGFWNGTSNVSGVLTINPVSYTITASAGSGGSISPSGSVTVTEGNDQSFTITANSGYAISDVLVDNVSQGAINSYTFSNVTGNHTISASFAGTTLLYYNLQWPPTATITQGSSVNVYAQTYEPGVTEAAGAGAGISAWIGYSSSNTDPSGAGWTWVAASFNTQVGNNDEFVAGIGSTLAPGTYYYASRFQRNGGAYYYGGFNGGAWNGTSNVSGVLTVNCSTGVTYYTDADGDGYGTGSGQSFCTNPGTGWSLNNTDCDDNNIAVHAQFSFYVDGDGDGYGTGSLVQVCAVDANTPPTGYSTNNTDCDDNNVTVYAQFSFYVDGDGDGYGTGSLVQVCAVDANTPPTGYRTNNTDCNDADGTVWQSASLYIDNDGDGYTNGQQTVCYGASVPAGYSLTSLGSDCNDNNTAIHAQFGFYADGDGDGYGEGSLVQVCAVDANTPPTGYSTNNTDCNDADGTVWQSASLYIDNDGDGYTNGQQTVCYGASVPAGYTLTSLGSDCNDSNTAVHAQFGFYADGDGDGYGAGSLVQVCAVDANTPPAGYSTNNTDCNDNDNTKWQSALLYIDNDGDGYTNGQTTVCYGASIPSGYTTSSLGSDCNDNDNTKWQSSLLYTDNDGDGYTVGSATSVCYGASIPTGYTATSLGTDCDDSNSSKWRTALVYTDNDGDGYTVGSQFSVCYGAALPTGLSTTSLGSDCNDADAAVHALPVVAAISGGSSICIGSSLQLTDATAGGVWSSSDNSKATVNSSGLVTGVSSGTVTISYAVSNSCGATTVTKSVTVNGFSSGVTVFTESMGTVSATTTIAAQEAANGFDNDNLTMSGTGDLRTSSASSGYTGASGNANVFLTTTVGQSFQIADINTTGLSNLTLSFGIFKSTTASNGSDLIVEVSSDGTTYTPLSFTALPTGTGTAVWALRTATGSIPATANLRVRFRQNGTATQYRIDDVKLTGTSSTLQITKTDICGGKATLTSGSGNSYSWSNGATTQSTTVSADGTYTVTVTDANGCTASASIAVTLIPALTVSATQNAAILCNGGTTSVTVTPSGGTAPYNITGSNTTNLAAGTYNYTVTDASGCTATTSIVISQPSAITFAAPVVTNVSCFGGNNGKIVTSASGGTAAISYSISPNVGTQSPSGTFNNLTAQTYTLTATDASGCTATSAVTVTQPTQLVATETHSNVLCKGGNTGSATISATGGTAPYTGTGLQSGLIAGSYTYTVTDANGCTATVAVSIIEPAILSLSTTQTDITCNGDTNGTINLTATGGTQGEVLTITQNFDGLASSGSPAWSDGITVSNWFVYNQTSGATFSTYTASDGSSAGGGLYSFGTTSTSDRAIGTLGANAVTNQGDAMYSGIKITNTKNHAMTSITVNYNGEQWRDGGNTATQSLTFDYQINASSISATSGWTAVPALDFASPIHTASAQTLNGNSAANRTAKSATFNINLLPGQSMWLRWKDVNDAGADHGLSIDDLVVTLKGNTSSSPYTYAWTGTGVNATAEDQSGLTAGTYNVTVTDANGCTAATSVTLTVTDNIKPVITATGTTLSLGCNPSAADIDAALGSATATDNCTVGTPVAVDGDVTVNGCQRSQTRTWTVSDNNGNAATAVSRTVTWTVVTAPVLSGVPTGGNLGINPTRPACDNTVTASNECGAVPVTCNPGPVNSNGCGRTQLFTYTATDACSGLSSSAQVTYSWTEDNTPPDIVCAGPVTKYIISATDCSIAKGLLPAPSVTDICGIASITNDAPARFPLGQTVVTWTATDYAGNSATCTQLVTVIDDAPPLLTIGTIASCYKTVAEAEDAAIAATSATDNCGGVITKTASTNGTCNAEITVTVSDQYNNSNSFTYNTRIDDTAPVITTTATSGDLGCNPTVAAPVFTGTDNCEGTITPVVTTTGASNVGCAYTQTWNANYTDGCGNAATQVSITYTWTVDTQAPTVTKGTIAAWYPTVSAAEAAAIAATSSSDNCMGALTTTANTVGDCSAVITVTVTDGCGNSSSVQYNTGIDNTPPTAVCKNIVINLSAAGRATITAADIDGGSSDGCGAAVTLGASKTSFDCSNLGNNTVTLTVTDAGGNSATCSATVTVKDVTPPTAVCKNITINLGAAGAATTITAADIDGGSSDGCGAAVTLGASKTSFDCSNLGANTVTLTVTDASGNTATCSATVTIKDVTPPIAVCKNITVNLSAAGTATINAADIDGGSSDGCGEAVTLDASKTSFDCSNLGANTVTLTVTDASGNTATCSATVTVKDVTPPTAVCKNITVNLSAAGTATINAADINGGSSDGCGAAVTLGASKTSFDCSNLGNNTVILTVTDASGNTATCSATVTIKDVTPPTAVCKNITVNLSAAGTASITAADIDGGSSDGCGAAVTLGASKTSFDCSNLGNNTVILTVTDASGNTATCSATVTIKDVTPPTAVCKNITVNLSAAGTASIAAIDIDGGSSDACGISTRTAFPNTFTCANVGLNTVILTVTDVSGNTATCTATVTVKDVTAPTITCPSPVITTNDPSVCGRVVSGLAPAVSDVCGIATVTYTINGATTGSGVNDASGTTFKMGVSTVTYLVTDVNGNTNNCSFTVTVNPAPVVTNLYIESLPTTTAYQYSDRIKFTASIKSTATPAVSLGTTTCGPKAADAVNFYIGTQLMGTVPFTASGDSLVATLTVPMLETSFGGTVMDPNVNAKTASATLVNPNTVNYTGVVNPASKQFNMAKEDARIYYTGALFASTSGSSTSTATVTLSATVRDITAETGDPAYDAYAGDIRNAKVYFKVVETNTTYGPFSPGLVNVADLKTGTVTTNVTLNIGNADAAQFTVLMWVDGYYTRNSPEDAAIVTVAKPLNDFITGGGYVILSNSAGKKAGNTGSKNNFGFNVKWNKSNTNLQGNINTIIRRTEGGIVRVYQVKGNSMTSLSVSAATATTPGTAVFNGKANIQDITDPNNPLPVDGNASLQVTMTDMGEPGTNDRIAITVWDKSGGLWFANNWDGIKTNEQKLDGGNLKVQSSSNYVAGTIPTSITITSSVNPSTVGNAVTFKAVINETNAATPTGTVSFYDGSKLLVKVNVTTVNGVTSATLSTSSLSEGTHDITAYYGGDSKFASSTGTLTQNVLPSLGTISKINKTIDVSAANNTEGKLVFEPLIGPNPSDNVFKLMVKASSPEQINVTVVDVMGRQVKQLVTTPYQAISFGNEFKKGIYFLKVVQGKNHRTIKLFKL